MQNNYKNMWIPWFYVDIFLKGFIIKNSWLLLDR